MTAMSERERAAEAKFAHDQEFRFLAMARRDKLFAARIAGLLGLDGPASAVLTTRVLEVSGQAGHDESLLRLAHDTLAGYGQPTSQTGLVAALDECATDARRQLLDGLPMPSRTTTHP